MKKLKKWWLFALVALTPAMTMAGEGGQVKKVLGTVFGIGSAFVFLFCCFKIWHLIVTRDQRENTLTEIAWTAGAAIASAVVGVLFTASGMSSAAITPNWDNL